MVSGVTPDSTRTRSSAIAEGQHDAQLQNISFESPGPIVWHYLRDPTFSRFDTIPEFDRHTHTHTDRPSDT